MRIVHITNCLRGGGIQNFLLSLASEQAMQNHNVTIIVIEHDTDEYCANLESMLKQNGVSIYHLYKKRQNKLSLIKTLIRCRHIIRKIKPDIINSHGEMSHFYAGVSACLTRIPHCITIHTTPEYWNIPIKLLNKRKPLIYCSDAAYKARIQVNKTAVTINNGINPKIVQTTDKYDLRSELHLSDEDKIIILVGSLRVAKNYEFLKEIVQALNDPHIHFCVCGGSYGEGYISTESFKKYPTIHFIGLRSNVSAIENGSDVYLSCSTFEGLPMAVLEAFFNGIPCVLSPIVQHRDIAQNVPACIIPKDYTAADFATEIRTALTIKLSHDDIYKDRLPYIRKYSITDTTQKYISFYENCINR